jgi:hypothetical protein
MSDPILELLAAPPSPIMAVDESAVHAGGRRRLRRRTLRRTGIGVAGLVGAAAIAFGTLGAGPGGEALPAGPSPTTSSTFSAVADVLDGRYAVKVVPGAPSGQPNVVFYAVRDGKRQQLAGSDASPDVVSLGTGSGADGVMLGTAPADATAFLTITRDGTQGGIQTDHQPLPGTAYQAVALKFDDPKEVDAYVDTFWTNSLSEVRTARGSLLASVPTNDGDRFFLAREASTMGVFMADGSGGSTRPLTTGDSTTMGYGQKTDGGEWSWKSVTQLPKGSRDVSFEWADASRTTDVTTGSLGTAEVAFASATAPAAGSGPTVTSVSWTDTAGTRHTEAVR